MKYQNILLFALAAACLAGNVFADDVQDLAKAKACLACHSIEKKLVGPAFTDVAAKYKGQEGAAAMLAQKVQTGGKGVWGSIPMPASKVTPEEALVLARWILSRN